MHVACVATTDVPANSELQMTVDHTVQKVPGY